MSKGTGVKGYTPDRLRRSKEAAVRQAERDQRTPSDQMALVNKRPGESAKERGRLDNG